MIRVNLLPKDERAHRSTPTQASTIRVWGLLWGTELMR